MFCDVTLRHKVMHVTMKATYKASLARITFAREFAQLCSNVLGRFGIMTDTQASYVVTFDCKALMFASLPFVLLIIE